MKDNEFAENAIEPLIVEKAKDYRKDNPGLGCAKLYLVIKKLFEQTGCMPGRDAFIELLRQNRLMVQIKRRRHYKTTDSSHHYHKYENLIKDVVPSRPNEIWVSDITYVETEEGVCYLSLITDAYSHMIVGWAVGPTLEIVYQELERIILFYNTERPHMSIGMQTPSMAHTQTGEQKRCWRNPWENHAAAPPDQVFLAMWHYFSVVRKPIAGRLLLSRACFLFGFCIQSYIFSRKRTVFRR